MNKTGQLDKSKYPNKDNIGKIVRKAADDYFNSVKSGIKKTKDIVVKRVYARKAFGKKGGGR